MKKTLNRILKAMTKLCLLGQASYWSYRALLVYLNYLQIEAQYIRGIDTVSVELWAGFVVLNWIITMAIVIFG